MSPALATDAKPDAAETAAAMERAKRLAANPLRVILEASKVKRKIVAEPEPAATAATTNATTAANATAQAAPAPVALIGTAAGNPVPVRSEEGAPATPAAAPALRQSPMRTLSAAPIAASVASVVPAMAATDKLTAPASMPATTALALPAAAVSPPRLIDMVEPVIPPRLLEQIGVAVEFNADLTIRPDGTVALVSLVPPVNRTISRYVVAAMERWRFSPLPGEQVHRVQLVFNDGR